MKTNQSGYILVLTLLVVSILTMLVTQVFYQSSSNFTLMNTLVKREKAKILALSGIQFAIDKLSVKTQEEKAGQKVADSDQSKKSEVSGDEKLNKELLKNVLPIINKWQIIEFKDDNDEIDGKVNICICCENGKLNINKMYDFKKHQFINQGQAKNDYQKLTQDLFKKMESLTEQRDVMQAFQRYLSERKFPLNETTEILNIKNSDYFQKHVFYEPVQEAQKNDIYLTDLFTIWTDDNKLEPWLLSNSTQILFGLDVNKDDIQKRKQLASEWVSKFKKSSEWNKDWNNVLKPLYKKDFSALSKDFVNILNATFTAKVFSVICYGTVAGVTQKIYGILQVEKSSTSAEKSSGNSANKQENDTIKVTLKKLYWV